jgi:endonuclease/exonuclease/phosphatase family metal-dependent hydrolase
MIKLATYNIHYGAGRDGRIDVARAIAVVADADIIALQEVENGWDRSGNVDQPSAIRDLLPLHEAAWGPVIDVWKRRDSGDRLDHVRSLRRQYGNMILSRFPIVAIRNHLLSRYGGARNILEMQRGALEAIVDAPGGMLRIYSVHLDNMSEWQRARQAEELLAIHARAVEEGPVLSGVLASDPTWTSEPPLPPVPGHAVMMGDFNFQPATPGYQVLAGELNARYGTIPRRGGFVDAWRTVGNEDVGCDARGAVPGATAYDSFLRKDGRRIDYCFVSDGLASRIAACEVLADAAASDHQPLVAALR